MKARATRARTRKNESAGTKRGGSRRGIDHWMEQVLKRLKAAGRKLGAEPVHQLRVAIRQCRSMADAYVDIDPDAEWESVKKSTKKLFQNLGSLRDVQVAADWIKALDPAASPLAEAMLKRLSAEKKELKDEARAAHAAFDRKSWKEWMRRLPDRVREFRPGNPAFQQVALTRWSEARDLHERALRSPGSRASWHRLRIGIKRFRYIVENFLPDQFGRWTADLKRLQEILGELHDLDVLRERLSALGSKHEKERRSYWKQRIEEERQKRIAEYRKQTSAKPSPYARWRSALPGSFTGPPRSSPPP